MWYRYVLICHLCLLTIHYIISCYYIITVKLIDWNVIICLYELTIAGNNGYVIGQI